MIPMTGWRAVPVMGLRFLVAAMPAPILRSVSRVRTAQNFPVRASVHERSQPSMADPQVNTSAARIHLA